MNFLDVTALLEEVTCVGGSCRAGSWLKVPKEAASLVVDTRGSYVPAFHKRKLPPLEEAALLAVKA